MKTIIVFMWAAIVVTWVAYGQAAQVSEVSDFVEQFEDRYNTQVGYIDISFIDKYDDPQQVGECNRYYYRNPAITIRKSYWKQANYDRKLIMLFHELGHCAFNREHNESIYRDGCNKSFMSAILMSSGCFELHKNEIYNELKRK